MCETSLINVIWVFGRMMSRKMWIVTAVNKENLSAISLELHFRQVACMCGVMFLCSGKRLVLVSFSKRLPPVYLIFQSIWLQNHAVWRPWATCLLNPRTQLSSISLLNSFWWGGGSVMMDASESWNVPVSSLVLMQNL